MSQSELEKVRFFDADVGYENLWAEKRNVNLYVIQSIPYFIYDISVEDVIRVAKDEADQTLCFSEVVTHSEHSTIRVRPKDFTLDQREGEELLRKIESFGAVSETLPPRLVAVDIPSCGDVEPLTRFLTESHIPWEWGDKAPYQSYTGHRQVACVASGGSAVGGECFRRLYGAVMAVPHRRVEGGAFPGHLWCPDDSQAVFDEAASPYKIGRHYGPRGGVHDWSAPT